MSTNDSTNAVNRQNVVFDLFLCCGHFATLVAEIGVECSSRDPLMMALNVINQRCAGAVGAKLPAAVITNAELLGQALSMRGFLLERTSNLISDRI